MPRAVLVLALGVGLAVAAGILILGRGEPAPVSPEDRTVERRPAERHEPAGEIAPLPPPEPEPDPDPDAEPPEVVAAWERAGALLEEGRPIDALGVLRPLRDSAPASFEPPERAALVTRIEEAAVAAIEKALEDGKGRHAAIAFARLERLVADPADLMLLRGRVDGEERRLVGARAGAERRVVARARNAAERGALKRHLQRFGGTSRRTSSGRKRPAVDRLLDQVEKRPAPAAEALPVPDPDEVEKRRIEQLEKLRQRDAVVLLDHIAAGLAWLALHQGTDGRITVDSAHARCKELEHRSACVRKSTSRYPVASTALAVLAFLDFRDQDVHGLFEPALAAGVDWLLRVQKKDGSFPSPRGYSNAIALMALGQAAATSERQDVRAAVVRGLAWLTKNAGAQGGFRYKPGQAGDLSVTGWVVQAVEAAATAEIAAPRELLDGLRAFWKWTWLGGARFSYLAQGTERSALAPVGMLAGTFLKDPSIGRPTRTAWRKALRTSSRPRLYTLYYGVRVLLAMDGKLPKSWNDWVIDLAKAQIATGSAAGSIKPRPWSLRENDTVIRTAFAILTLEHSLYRR